MSESDDGRTPLIDGYMVVARTSDLEPGEKALWFAIRGKENEDGRGCFAGDELLAAYVGRSERSIQEYRASMLEKGYLRRQLRGPKPAYWWATVPDNPTIPDGKNPQAEDHGEASGFPSSRFVDAIREHWWLGDDIPGCAPEEWAISADLRYLRKFWGSEGEEESMSYIRGVRTLADDGELGPKVQGEPFTSAYLQRHAEIADQSLWSRALEADRRRGEEPADESPLSEMTEQILQGAGAPDA